MSMIIGSTCNGSLSKRRAIHTKLTGGGSAIAPNARRTRFTCLVARAPIDIQLIIILGSCPTNSSRIFHLFVCVSTFCTWVKQFGVVVVVVVLCLCACCSAFLCVNTQLCFTWCNLPAAYSLRSRSSNKFREQFPSSFCGQLFCRRSNSKSAPRSHINLMITQAHKLTQVKSFLGAQLEQSLTL